MKVSLDSLDYPLVEEILYNDGSMLGTISSTTEDQYNRLYLGNLGGDSIAIYHTNK